MTLHNEYFRSKFWEMTVETGNYRRLLSKRKDNRKKIKDSEAQRGNSKVCVGNISKTIKDLM